jgi:hypothetical protein
MSECDVWIREVCKTCCSGIRGVTSWIKKEVGNGAVERIMHILYAAQFG